jgi:hypothetical protein
VDMGSLLINATIYLSILLDIYLIVYKASI